MKKLLILGAGASYGHGYELGHKPPLASQFFTCSTSEELFYEYKSLITFLKDKLHIDISSTDIESLYEEVETIGNLLPRESSAEVEEYFNNIDFFVVTPTEYLKSYIIDIIYESTKWLDSNNCPFHDCLVNKYLWPGDSIISFNYDLIVDCSLRKTGTWEEKDGYGFNTKTKSKYMLLKPHGSINWSLLETQHESNILRYPSQNDDNRALKETIGVNMIEYYYNKKHKRLATYFNQTGKAFFKEVGDRFKDFRTLYNNEFNYPYLIYPTKSKLYRDMTFGQLKNVWSKMYKSLLECNEIVSIGFSFRDEHFNRFIRIASMNRTKTLVIKLVDKNKEILSSLESKFDTNKIKFIHVSETLLDFCNNFK